MTYVTAEQLKQRFSAEQYYRLHLAGGFGKVTGGGWHRWNGLCPFHADRRPGSFVINKRTGAFRCFSCGASGGDVIDFHMQKEAVSFRQALSQLALLTQLQGGCHA